MVKCKTTNFVEERIGINPHKHGVGKIIIIIKKNPNYKRRKVKLKFTDTKIF